MEKFKYNTIDEAIAAIKAGQMVLVTDTRTAKTKAT